MTHYSRLWPLTLLFLSGFSLQAQDKSGSRPGLMKLPESGGTVTSETGSFSIASNKGSSQYNLPLPELPTRAGFGPKVALSYNQFTGDQGQGLGISWSLGIPSIEASTELGIPLSGVLPSGEFRNFFTFQGQKLVFLRNSVGKIYYRLKASEEYIQFIYHNNPYTLTKARPVNGVQPSMSRGFEVIYPNGRRQLYSGDPSVAEGSTKNITRYVLTHEVDTTGETISYSYMKDAGRSYLQEIVFAGGASRYRFEMIDGLGHLHSYAMGHQQENRKLYSKLIASYNDSVQAQWCMAYVGRNPNDRNQFVVKSHADCQDQATRDLSGQIDGNSLSVLDELRSIYRYGSASTLTAETERLPTMRFAYSSWSQDRLASRDLVYPLTSLAESAQFSVQNYELADVNHDGLVDAIRKNSNGTSDIFSSTGDLQNLFKKPDFWKLTSRDRSVSPDLSSTNFHFADFNGDSFVDLLQYDSADTFIYFGGAAGGFTWTGRSVKLTADDSLHAASFFRGQAQFTDINNDGKSDVITTAFDTNGQTVWKVYLNLSIQDGNRWQFKFSPKTFAFPFPDSQINLSDNNFRLTDVNGDKLPDVIYLSSSVEADQSGLCVYLNQGKLYDLDARDLLFGNNQETSPRCGRGGRFISLHGLQGKTNLNGLWLADVNGDGILDVTTIGQSNQDLLVWLGFGDLAVSRDPLTLRLKVPVQVSSSFDASRSRVADIDGDGQVEILVFDESASTGNKALMIDFNREKDRQLIKSNLLVTVDFESGLRYDIRYATSTTERLRDLRLGQPTSALHFPVVVAKQLISSMGVPSLARRSVQVQEFFYHRPYYDPDNKEFLGFSEVETLVYGDNYTEESSYTQESFHTYSSDIASRLMAGKTRSKKVFRVMEDDWFTSMSQSTNKFDPTNPSTHSWLNESEGQQLPRLGQVVAEETQTWETVPAEGQAYYLRKTAQTMRRNDEDKGSASSSPLLKTVVFSDFDSFNMPRLMEETVDAIEAPFDLRLPSVQTVTRLDYESSRLQFAEQAIIDRPDYEMVQRGETVASFTQYQYNDQGQVLVESDFVESHMPVDAPEIVQNGLGSYERKITYAYDEFGNKVSETDALGLLESIEYDEQGVFAVRRTLPKANPSSEDSVWTMEYDAGRLKSFTSPIGLKTSFSYDQLGRRVRMLTSDGSEQLYAYRQGLDGHPSMMLTKIRRYPDATPAADRESTWVAHLSAYRADGLKLAEVEDASEGHKGSRRGIRVKEYAAYDRNKRQIFTWTPYSLFEDSPSVEQVFASSPDIPQPKETVGTWFRYDYLGRLKQRQQPTGLVETYSYAPWGETNLQSFNRLDKHIEVKTYSISHELGIYANVQEDLSSKERHVTRFERDALGKLTSIELPGVNQTRRLAHDSRGLIEFQEIPGLGRWYYLYDQRDHLVKTIRVNADESVTHVVENAYDLQDRLISQTLDGQLTHVNTYDVYPDDWKPRAGLLKQPIGLVTATKSFDHNLRTLNYSKFLSYDNSGMLTEVEAKLGDKSWKESYGYLLDGSAKSMTNPSGLEGIYTNDEAGRLRSVAIRLPGTSKLESVIDSVSYDSKGRMNEIYYRPVGDSLSSTRLGYNPRTLLLEEIKSIYRVAGQEYPLQDLKQVTDENAYILAIEDRIKANEFGLVNRSASFDYNWKGELTQSKRYTKTYEYRYSPAGTFTRNDEQGPGTIRTAAASDLLPQGPAGFDYGFDSFGQLTKSPVIQNARYNALGQMTMVETSTNLTNFGYNATGERIWKQVQDKASGLTLTSYYPLKSVMLEPKSGQSFIFVGDQRLVRLEDASGDWYYYLKDHLGSSDIVMHSSGKPVEQMLYQPYGSEEDPAKMSAAWASYSKTPSLPVPLVKTHHRFTGHYLDDESGLYYMNARYYDAKLGRFATPDPLYLGEPERCAKRPVECNLYSYAQNNPIKYIDPSGLITYNADNKTWSVDKGDTVDSIAKDTGFTAKEIKDANGGDKFVPKAGSSITIPQNTRIKTFEEAAGQIGSKDYAYATRKENFGANKWKCNQFVHNMIRDSGGKPPKSGKSIWPAQAGDWGGKASLKNTTLLAKGYQEAAPGDVVGWKRDYSDATGHTMIYAGNVKILSGGQVFQSKGGGGFIGASSAEVEYRSYDTMSRYKPTEGVYRRVQ